MELKCLITSSAVALVTLLIVPYGIEIPSQRQYAGADELLIVPYGIEIIVSLQDVTDLIELLIVPYGIEIKYTFTVCVCPVPFNRTLWN